MRTAALPRHSRSLAVTVAVLASALVSSDLAASGGSRSMASSFPPPADRKLVFSATFAGSELDGAQWTTCYPWANQSGCTNASNGELQWYQPSGVSVSGGALHLTARREDVVGGDKRYEFTSGMVTTAKAFTFTYGYVAFRARLPRGPGLWPALWLLPSNESWPPEIDVIELFGGHPTRAALTYHPPKGAQRQQHVTTPDLSVGWHDFAIDWRPGSIQWWIDGVPRFRVSGDVPSQPMYLLMDLAVSGTQPPSRSTRFPASLDVQYVRVWQPG
jgi:beta-glucanase (GH16 family)